MKVKAKDFLIIIFIIFINICLGLCTFFVETKQVDVVASDEKVNEFSHNEIWYPQTTHLNLFDDYYKKYNTLEWTDKKIGAKMGKNGCFYIGYQLEQAGTNNLENNEDIIKVSILNKTEKQEILKNEDIEKFDTYYYGSNKNIEGPYMYICLLKNTNILLECNDEKTINDFLDQLSF